MTGQEPLGHHVSKKSEGDIVKPKKQYGKQNTHFLCFPLVNDTSVPQLVESLQHFRDVTITSPSPATVRTQTTSHETEPHDTVSSDPLGNLSRPTTSTLAESLKVLPRVVHRPPGTYHLTIGVMQLDSREKLQDACELLQSLDLRQMFQEACRRPPTNTHSKKWPMDTISEDNSGILRCESTTMKDHDLAVDESAAILEASVAPIRLTLRGLSTFGSSKRASVIYANPHDQALTEQPHSHHSTSTCPTLHSFALHLDHAFRQGGFFRDTRPITLHATVANMRYANQAKRGRTSKGRNWTHGKDRWRTVDARDVFAVFNRYGGDIKRAEEAGIGLSSDDDQQLDVANADIDDEGNQNSEAERSADGDDDLRNSTRDAEVLSDQAFVFAKDVLIDRVAICRMGATPSDDPLLGAIYPPVSEKLIFD